MYKSFWARINGGGGTKFVGEMSSLMPWCMKWQKRGPIQKKKKKKDREKCLCMVPTGKGGSKIILGGKDMGTPP